MAKRKVISIRLPRKQGKEVWRKGGYLTKVSGKLNAEQKVELFDVVVSGRTIELPKAQILRMFESAKEANIIGGKEGKNLAKKIREEAFNFKREQLISFLGRMPDIVKGMLEDANMSNSPPELKKVLKSIIKKVEQMTFEQRNEFYNEYGDLFEDTTDWYTLMKRYGWRPGNFELDPEDKRKLQEKGFNSIDEYYKHIIDNLNNIDSILDDYISINEVEKNIKKKKVKKK